MANQPGRGHCAACNHPDSDALNQALIMKSETTSALARKYGIDRTNLNAHKKNHLSPALVSIRQGLMQKSAETALEKIKKMISLQEQILYPASPNASPNVNQAMAVMREYRATLELYAKVTGELDERPQTVVNVASSQEWVDIRTSILRALQPYPEALRAVAKQLSAVA